MTCARPLRYSTILYQQIESIITKRKTSLEVPSRIAPQSADPPVAPSFADIAQSGPPAPAAPSFADIAMSSPPIQAAPSFAEIAMSNPGAAPPAPSYADVAKQPADGAALLPDARPDRAQAPPPPPPAAAAASPAGCPAGEPSGAARGDRPGRAASEAEPPQPARAAALPEPSSLAAAEVGPGADSAAAAGLEPPDYLYAAGAGGHGWDAAAVAADLMAWADGGDSDGAWPPAIPAMRARPGSPGRSRTELRAGAA
jgi:hypothetical protein